MGLFWHGILCTGNSKCEHGRQIQLQLDMFRDLGMGNFDVLLKGCPGTRPWCSTWTTA